MRLQKAELVADLDRLRLPVNEYLRHKAAHNINQLCLHPDFEITPGETYRLVIDFGDEHSLDPGFQRLCDLERVLGAMLDQTESELPTTAEERQCDQHVIIEAKRLLGRV